MLDDCDAEYWFIEAWQEMLGKDAQNAPLLNTRGIVLSSNESVRTDSLVREFPIHPNSEIL